VNPIRTYNIAARNHSRRAERGARLLDQKKTRMRAMYCLGCSEHPGMVDKVTPLPLVFGEEAERTAKNKAKGQDPAQTLSNRQAGNEPVERTWLRGESPEYEGLER